MRDARQMHASFAVYWRHAVHLARCWQGAGRRAATVLPALLVFLCCTLQRAGAQSRPWLNWRTIETDHFSFHFPEEYRTWTLALAQRMEGVRLQVLPLVGFAPNGRVQVVVDDPANVPNGEAFTPLDAPTIILFPTPPNPRDEIGNYGVWGELLATHEFAHVAHLTRPSRNRLKNLLWSLSPVPIGPIAENAPRWVLEGYATFVEGRVTGSGRPNHAWRAAILRQFALEGRLPPYSQISATGSWETSSFAYLAGSAYLEWLARREGDSSVTALWRRLTAKTVRSFDEAFIGVYGLSPAQLYAQFTAEVTADALGVSRALAKDALVTGTLVQRLSQNTGDPAVSPDGRFIALTMRRGAAPAALVVWQTEDERDTLALRRRETQIRIDPEDVPDRAFFPPPKRVLISLVAEDGAPYESPRWMPDNKHLLVTRRLALPDGTVRADLFTWSAEDNSLRRITRGAAVRNADPSSDGRWAAAERCDAGWCDLVQVDLATGKLRVIIAGSPVRNFYRPRVSRVTGEIAVAEQLGDRWRIARVNPATGALVYADPDDGAIRFDATFDADGRTIVATSELSGVANLERLSVDASRATALTAVTGAAVGADNAPDGTVWFLSLHASGYDLRRIKPDGASSARAGNAARVMRLALVDSGSPVLPPRTVLRAPSPARRPVQGTVSDEMEYGDGPSRVRYLPGSSSGSGGTSFHVAIVRSDPVGRVGVSLLAAAGAGPLPAGLGFQIRDRSNRKAIFGNLWSSHEAPSRQFAQAFDEGLDLSRTGGGISVQQGFAGDGGEIVASLGLLGEYQHASAFESNIRAGALAAIKITGRQRDEDARFVEELTSAGELGSTAGGVYYRQRSSFVLGTGSNASPLSFGQISYGTLGGGVGADREQFTIGGFASPLIDPLYDGRRVDAPAYPVGSSASRSYIAYRITAPFSVFDLYYSAVTPDVFKTEFRSYGAEFREHLTRIPALATPDVDALVGFARAIDAPVTKELRLYFTLSIHP